LLLAVLIALVLVLSALREGLGVFWVHFAERDDGHRVGVVAMVQAGAEIAGVGLSIRVWPCAVAYVAGHYVGVQIAMREKKRKRGMT
jgi:hypothetical protein